MSVLNENLWDYKTFENLADETTANPTFNSKLCVHINIVSSQKNFHDFRQFLSQFKGNIGMICLSEMYLPDESELLQSLWLSFVLLQFKNKSSGFAIYVSDVIKSKQMSIKINTDGCEDVWMKSTLNQNKSLILGLAYRHPSKNIKPFENAFVNIIKNFGAKQNYAAMGD